MIENPTLRAVIWMLGAMFSLFSVGLLGKLLAPQYDTFEIMFFRSAIGFALFCGFIWSTGNFQSFHIKNLPLHFFRNITHFTAQNLWFFALAALPLAVVVTFEFTTPSWVIVIAAFALGEGFGKRRAWVIALSLLGIVLITDPRHVTFGPPVLAAMFCAIGFAVTMILTKRLTREQNVYEILFMMTLLQTIFAAIILLARGDVEMPTLPTLPYWLLMAFFGTSSHYCLTRALSLADASIVSPVDLLRLPLSVFAGWALFNEAITLPMFVGTLILICANYINIRRKA